MWERASLYLNLRVNDLKRSMEKGRAVRKSPCPVWGCSGEGGSYSQYCGASSYCFAVSCPSILPLVEKTNRLLWPWRNPGLAQNLHSGKDEKLGWAEQFVSWHISSQCVGASGLCNSFHRGLMRHRVGVIIFFNFSAMKEIKGLFSLLIVMTDSQFALIHFRQGSVQ